MSYNEFVDSLEIDPILRLWYQYAGILDKVLAELYIDYLNENITEVL